MSHSAVLVVGNNPENQLAPFHEFECTGIDDQYVQDIDITEEASSEYEKSKEHQLVAPDGAAFSFWDDRFYRDMTPEEEKIVGPLGGFGSCKLGSFTSKDWGDGKGYHSRLHYIPEGYVEREVPISEVVTFVDWAVDYYGYKTVELPDELGEGHKYGYIRVEEGEVRQIIKRTNPNAKWDWYELGGRWRGYFLLKDGSRSSVAQKGKIDFDGMRLKASVTAGEEWDKVHTAVAGRAIPKWETIRQSHDNIDAAREAYHNDPVIKDVHKLDVWIDVERFDCSREEFRRRAIQAAVPTFAAVFDGKWYERGEMGWWGMIRNEKDANDWAEEFNKLIDGLPDDTLLSVFDCHI